MQVVALLLLNVPPNFHLLNGPYNPIWVPRTNINSNRLVEGGRFLSGDTICSSDCELMPKLQHIRIAGSFLADFNIPLELTGLWKYFEEMYNLPAFVQSCPFDQDIINHYKQQKGLPLTRKEKLEAPTFTITVPSS